VLCGDAAGDAGDHETMAWSLFGVGPDSDSHTRTTKRETQG
jgi:hypothetical protein